MLFRSLGQNEWEKGQKLDLLSVQEELRKNDNFNFAPMPQKPEEDIRVVLQTVEPQMRELREASLRPYEIGRASGRERV